MSQKVNTKVATSTVTVSPVARVFRTILQTILAFGAAEPILIGGLGLTGARASQVAAVVSALVAAASTIQNVAEHLGIIPVAGGKVPASGKAPSA